MAEQVDPMLQPILGLIAFVFFGLVAIFAPRIIRFFHSFRPKLEENTLQKVAKVYRVAGIFLAGMGLAMFVLSYSHLR